MHQNSLVYAQQLDRQDPLRHFRDRFHIPQRDGKPLIYFTGNSLGLQPKSAKAAVEQELEDWATLGVEGHFHGRNPWYSYHEMFEQPLAEVVGAKPVEVACMNVLTVNLHLMMVSFYRPEGRRFKILAEAGAFPSDQYALESQARFHGYDPAEAVVEVRPREGEHTLRTEDILSKIEELGDELALVLFGGVNYYTGQAFDMKSTTEAGHKVGAMVGFDLAHAAGNLRLRLHDWGPDFAVWCSYKYLNSGPGGVSGAFVHERWANAPGLPRFAGWWGYDKTKRFRMQPGFAPMPGAAGWQLSNAQILPMAVHKASLDIFLEAGMDNLRAKSERLTGFLYWLIQEEMQQRGKAAFKVITPEEPAQRGAQLSILSRDEGRKLFDRITDAGIIADWREPNVVRIAPVPLYNTFEEAYRFVKVLFQ